MKGCAVCDGGWQNYWRIVLSTLNAKVCDVHLAENAASGATRVQDGTTDRLPSPREEPDPTHGRRE